MKKKILGGIAFAAVALALAFNLSVKQNTNQLSLLALANVEALANPEYGGVEDCDILKYNRNTKEQYVTTTVQYNADLGFYVKVAGRAIRLGGTAQVGGTVGVPDCTASPGNCCNKKFVDNPVRYY